MNNLLVMKFGGTSMGSAERIQVAAAICQEQKQQRQWKRWRVQEQGQRRHGAEIHRGQEADPVDQAHEAEGAQATELEQREAQVKRQEAKVVVFLILLAESRQWPWGRARHRDDATLGQHYHHRAENLWLAFYTQEIHQWPRRWWRW